MRFKNNNKDIVIRVKIQNVEQSGVYFRLMLQDLNQMKIRESCSLKAPKKESSLKKEMRASNLGRNRPKKIKDKKTASKNRCR